MLQVQGLLVRQYKGLGCWRIRKISQLSVLCFLEDWEEVRSVCGAIRLLDYVPINQCLAHQKEIMIFWFSPQILEDGLLPVSLHVIPIVNHSVPNWIVNTVTGRFHVGKSFITNEEVEVFNTSFRSKMPWFIWNGRCTRRLWRWSACRNCSRENAGLLC